MHSKNIIFSHFTKGEKHNRCTYEVYLHMRTHIVHLNCGEDAQTTDKVPLTDIREVILIKAFKVGMKEHRGHRLSLLV